MKRQWKVLGWLILVVLMVIFARSAFAEEYTNIGFKKDVSKELKQKFPMCEEFLDVKWIDEKNRVGKLKAEYYVGYKNNGVSYFLLDAGGTGLSSLVMQPFYSSNEQQYNSKEFDKFIQQAKFYFGQGILTAKVGKRKEKFMKLSLPFYLRDDKESTMESFAHYTKNICLIDPKEKTALIIEEKKPFQDKNLKGELKEKYEQILKIATERCNELKKTNKYIKVCNMESLRYGISIDLDFDGIEEYKAGFGCYYSDSVGKPFTFCGRGNAESLIFFTKEGKIKTLSMSSGCEGDDGFYSTAGAKAIFLNDCNLTNILIKGEK